MCNRWDFVNNKLITMKKIHTWVSNFEPFLKFTKPYTAQTKNARKNLFLENVLDKFKQIEHKNIQKS